ncbi:ChrR Cupin-like domain protein [Gimesia panareensis]|uniref:ChrR Cupin-like domain protein n=1 Tax=Gimesia panareensis TaxID=2527978 RepID=A0A518FW35_9PLAN|nr:cupin domain-containing protein [Gimesia panareensis]QDV20559.1 ChrR Cupin-like domain protein [Gimesia panareensis]
MQQQSIYTPDMPWEKLTEFPGEGEVKRLRDQETGKGQTILVRLSAGGQIRPHAHTTGVQHYVLEGEYESEGKIYGAGTYRLLPGHENVADISTQNGVTILMIYDPVG